jgi:putative flippase GtrA
MNLRPLTTVQRTLHPTIIQFLKFGIVGSIGFVLDNAAVYLIIGATGLSSSLAALIDFLPIATLTWLGNRYFTFREAKRTSKHKQWIKFLTVCGIGLVFNRGTALFLFQTYPFINDHPILGLAAGTGVAMFFNFFFSKKLVFR